MGTTDIQHIVGATTPSRAAIRLVAASDEAFLIDVFAAARVAANDTAGTFTAWVNIPDILGDYGVISCGDTAAVEYITLSVKAGKLRIQCYDATVQQYDHSSTNKVITPHKWHHIAVVQNADTGATRPPKLYVDGVQVATTMADETDNGTWFADCDLIDDGSIGAAEEAGATAQTKEMIGAISDVKYWKVELTAAMILADYNGEPPAAITGTSSDFTDHWKMIDLVNEITVANNGVKGASIIYQNAYSEFTSRLFTVVTPAVVADTIVFSVDDSIGHAIVIKAA